MQLKIPPFPNREISYSEQDICSFFSYSNDTSYLKLLVSIWEIFDTKILCLKFSNYMGSLFLNLFFIRSNHNKISLLGSIDLSNTSSEKILDRTVRQIPMLTKERLS